MGRPSDFGTWYREQYPQVISLLTVVAGDIDDAADATADAFVRAYERWDRVQKMESPGGWLYTVALNVIRRRTRRHAVEQALLRRADPRPTESPVLAPEVWEAVRALSPRQRTAIALRYVLDLPEAEVARVMDVTRGAASAALVAARRTLMELLANDETDAEELFE
jgi:RNA polymerase sigma factor (sigma-70 family)